MRPDLSKSLRVRQNLPLPRTTNIKLPKSEERWLAQVAPYLPDVQEVLGHLSVVDDAIHSKVSRRLIAGAAGIKLFDQFRLTTLSTRILRNLVLMCVNCHSWAVNRC